MRLRKVIFSFSAIHSISFNLVAEPSARNLQIVSLGLTLNGNVQLEAGFGAIIMKSLLLGTALADATFNAGFVGVSLVLWLEVVVSYMSMVCWRVQYISLSLFLQPG